MKKIIVQILYAIATGWMVVSCTLQAGNENDAQLIDQAMQLSEQHPDSALVLLGKVDSSGLQAGQYAAYTLAKIQAKDWADRNIEGDTAIFTAREYFIAAKDNEKAALACFYSGKIYFLQGNHRQAIINCMKAQDLAMPLGNEALKARIAYYMGVVNYSMDEYDEALPYLGEAVRRYHQAGKLSNEAHTHITLGNTYLLKDNPDSALAAYGRAMRYAEANNDSAIQSMFFQNIGAYIEQAGDHSEAENLYRQAIGLTTRTDNRARLQLNLAEVFFSTNRMDSALYYSEKASRILEMLDDQLALLKHYRLMVLIDTKRGDVAGCEAYLSKYDSCMGNIYHVREVQNILEIQKKYQVEKLQDERIIERKNHAIVILCLALVVLILAGASIYFVRKNKIKKKMNADLLQKINKMQATKDEAEALTNRLEELLQVKTAKAGILEAELKEALVNIQRLELSTGQKAILENDLIVEKARVERLRKKKATRDKEISDIITQYFKIQAKIRRMTDEVAKSNDDAPKKKSEVEKELMDKLNTLIYGKSNVDYWITASRVLPKGLVEKLSKKFPGLSQKETTVLCLSYLNTSPDDIAEIMGIDVKTVYEYNHKLRDKLQLPPHTKINEYLDSIL